MTVQIEFGTYIKSNELETAVLESKNEAEGLELGSGA